ncbi:MAG: hypothetical protein V3U67_09990 [Gemmatimonadota bacterium]
MRRTILTALAVTVLAGLGAVPANAQWAEEEEAKAAAMEVITGLFDAMRAADSAAVRAAFHSDVQIASSFSNGEGVAGVQYGEIEGFVQGVGGAAHGDWDEQVGETELRAYDNLVTAAMPYVFNFKGEVSHCGVNTFQIGKIGEEWKVVGIIDTRRTEGCGEWLD